MFFLQSIEGGFGLALIGNNRGESEIFGGFWKSKGAFHEADDLFPLAGLDCRVGYTGVTPRNTQGGGEVEENDVDWYLVRFRDLKPGSSLLE